MKKNQKLLRVYLMGIITVLYVNSFLLGQEIEVKMEDGIPVVYNPKELVPLPNTPSHLILEENLMLGEPDENQDYPFSMFSTLKANILPDLLILRTRCYVRSKKTRCTP